MFGNSKNYFNVWSHSEHNPGRNSLGPRFGRGDIKLIILDLLKAKPSHGYELIQQLEKKFFGCYTPSSGTIYPTLQLLEDQNMVTSSQESGKKVYTITELGIKYLADNKNNVNKMLCRVGGSWGEHSELISEIKNSFSETAHLLLDKITSGKMTDTQKDELKQVFNKLSEDVKKIISQ